MAPPKRVLIVDDDESVRLFVAGVMEAEGWETVEALNGQQAIERAEAEKPDLIVLDVNMPVMDGFTAFRHLRDSPFTETIPIIMLTGVNEETGSNYDAGRKPSWTNPLTRYFSCKAFLGWWADAVSRTRDGQSGGRGGAPPYPGERAHHRTRRGQRHLLIL
jgi:CheY-like chemotaxis protein